MQCGVTALITGTRHKYYSDYISLTGGHGHAPPRAPLQETGKTEAGDTVGRAVTFALVAHLLQSRIGGSGSSLSPSKSVFARGVRATAYFDHGCSRQTLSLLRLLPSLVLIILVAREPHDSMS